MQKSQEIDGNKVRTWPNALIHTVNWIWEGDDIIDDGRRHIRSPRLAVFLVAFIVILMNIKIMLDSLDSFLQPCG